MIDCKLVQINRVKHSLPIKIKSHTHKYDELTYFISGCGTAKINGKIFNYKAGSFAFQKAGTVHDEYDTQPCDVIWMHFSFKIDGVNLNEGVFFDNDKKLFYALQKLRNLSLEHKKYTPQTIENCIAEIVITAAEQQCESEAFHDKLDWQKILNYIDTNANSQIDFVTLAQKNHYSYDRFRHLFSEHFEMSPYAYLTTQRIEYAKRLLKSSSLNITDIAFDCGFNSSSQFTNIFKKYVGVTPKSYRNRRK